MPLRLEALLADLAGPLGLTLVTGEAGLSREVATPDLHRPGLALSGFLDYYPADRLQILGKTEVEFWKTLPAKVRAERLEAIVSPKPVGFIVTHAMQPPADLVAACGAQGVTVLSTPVPTTKFLSDLTLHLEERLAPSVTLHGSLVDVYGVGVLIMGESGIGKSECALALLDKGHRLCADDVVEVRRTPEKTLLGTGVRSIKYHMEIRGLGIVDVQSLFGARAVRERKLVELVVQLVNWEPGRRYDRTGLEDVYETILEVPLPMHVLPVKTGRNIAVLVEVAAMNFRLRQMGIHPAERLNEQILQGLRLAGEATAAAPREKPRPAGRRRRSEER